MHFDGCRSARDVKKRFNHVSLTLHPDKGGTKAAFVELFDQYQEAKLKFSEASVTDRIEEEEEVPSEEVPSDSFREAEPTRRSKWDRWWAQLSQQELWDIIKHEHKLNKKSIYRQNQESLDKENKAENEQTFTDSQWCRLRVDYDSTGSVGQLRQARQAKSLDGLLLEMKQKREKSSPVHFEAPPDSKKEKEKERAMRVNKRKRAREREREREQER
jgi:hypothetical protein